jgi:hypothetical protein
MEKIPTGAKPKTEIGYFNSDDFDECNSLLHLVPFSEHCWPEWKSSIRFLAGLDENKAMITDEEAAMLFYGFRPPQDDNSGPSNEPQGGFLAEAAGNLLRIDFGRLYLQKYPTIAFLPILTEEQVLAWNGEAYRVLVLATNHELYYKMGARRRPARRPACPAAPPPAKAEPSTPEPSSTSSSPHEWKPRGYSPGGDETEEAAADAYLDRLLLGEEGDDSSGSGPPPPPPGAPEPAPEALLRADDPAEAADIRLALATLASMSLASAGRRAWEDAAGAGGAPSLPAAVGVEGPGAGVPGGAAPFPSAGKAQFVEVQPSLLAAEGGAPVGAPNLRPKGAGADPSPPRPQAVAWKRCEAVLADLRRGEELPVPDPARLPAGAVFRVLTFSASVFDAAAGALVPVGRDGAAGFPAPVPALLQEHNANVLVNHAYPAGWTGAPRAPRTCAVLRRTCLDFGGPCACPLCRRHHAAWERDIFGNDLSRRIDGVPLSTRPGRVGQ